MVILRLKTAFADWLKPEERDIINAIDDGKIHTVKITTEKLDVRKDRRDGRSIDSIRNVKLIYRT